MWRRAFYIEIDIIILFFFKEHILSHLKIFLTIKYKYKRVNMICKFYITSFGLRYYAMGKIAKKRSVGVVFLTI